MVVVNPTNIQSRRPPLLAEYKYIGITSDIVPGQLKSARVNPLFKKNNRTDVGNYMPTSILCIISKI